MANIVVIRAISGEKFSQLVPLFTQIYIIMPGVKLIL